MNSYKYSLKLSLYFKRYTRTLSIFNFGESTGDLHMIAMFRQQYKIVVLKCCCSFIQNSIKYICIYCHLTFVCFCITPFGICSGRYIKFYILLCSCLYFCLCLLTIHISFASLQYSTLQQFWHNDQVFSSFSCTYFLSSLFCQQPF